MSSNDMLTDDRENETTRKKNNKAHTSCLFIKVELKRLSLFKYRSRLRIIRFSTI